MSISVNAKAVIGHLDGLDVILKNAEPINGARSPELQIIDAKNEVLLFSFPGELRHTNGQIQGRLLLKQNALSAEFQFADHGSVHFFDSSIGPQGFFKGDILTIPRIIIF